MKKFNNRVIHLKDSDFALVMPYDGKGQVLLPDRDMSYRQSLFLMMSFTKLAKDMFHHLCQLNSPEKIERDLAIMKDEFYGGGV